MRILRLSAGARGGFVIVGAGISLDRPARPLNGLCVACLSVKPRIWNQDEELVHPLDTCETSVAFVDASLADR